MIFAFSKNYYCHEDDLGPLIDTEFTFKEMTLREFNENVVYCGVFLSLPSYNILLNKQKMIKEVLGVKWSNTFCDHVTLGFGQKEAERFVTIIGNNCTVNVSKNLVCTKNVCCAEVEKIHDEITLRNVVSANRYPHITLATAKDVKPFDSNVVLTEYYDKNGTSAVEISMPCKPILLSGTVCARMKDGTFAVYAGNQIKWNRTDGFTRF